MIFERLKHNIRLLEQLSIFCSDQDAIPGLIPDTAEYLFLSVLKRLQRSDLPGAHQQYQQLCNLLGVVVGDDDGQLEPLRTLLHLKMWEGSEQDRQKLQQFLVKELGLRFEAEPPVPLHNTGGDQDMPQTTAGNTAATASSTAQPAVQQLPSQLIDKQYSISAFKALLESSAAATAGGQSLTSMFDPSCLLDAVADESLPLQERVMLLQQGAVDASLLPVQLLQQLVQAWVATESWNNTPASNWVTSNWQYLTAEQATALRPLLPGPAYGLNPKVDRPYIAALVNKALAGRPAAAAAASSSPTPAASVSAGTSASGGDAAAAVGCTAGGEGSAVVVSPWSCRAEDAAAAVDLQRVLQLCDDLGPPADWVRLHAVHAQVQLQLKQQPCVEMQLFVSYMLLLGRATWSAGPSVTDNRSSGTAAPPAGQQQQQPMHVACSVCGMRPIIGPRFRSRTQFGFNVCVGCSGSQEAAAAAPLEEVINDDSIYMLPYVPLPEVLGQLPANHSEREAFARSLLLEMLQSPAVGDLFSPTGPCPLAAAGLLLPADWRDAAVAEGKLLSGSSSSSDAAAWSRLYQKHADAAALAARTELSFAQHNRCSYALGEEVTLHLDTKNVGPQGVLVKVYEINAWNYYTSEGCQVQLSLELSGLAPTTTVALNTPQDPVIRTRHSIPLGLAGIPGVWLVEAVANGQVVRARIQKGSLRLTERPTVAGQVLTVLDEDWRPVKGVRVWCDGKQYAASASGPQHEVLLPYARVQQEAALVMGAQLQEAAEPAKECVVLIPDFKRLSEQYTLKAQLYCHQEFLLPGQTVPLLLQLALQLHGRPAPLQLLQEVALRLTATTQEGADVTQVFKDITVDPSTCQLQLQYNLPQGTVRLAAALTAKLLLTLPGTNGEPAWQEFELSRILPGQQGQRASVEINSMSRTGAIWDIFLTTTTTAASAAANPAAAAAAAAAATTHSSSCSSSTDGAAGSTAAAPEYVLQVLGRSGEAPATPKTLLVLLNHVAFQPHHQLQFRVQTGPGGVVRLGRLQGIRQIKAQIEAGVSHVEVQSLAAGSGVPQGLAAAAEERVFSIEGEGKGPMRTWQVARASWWQGGLQHEYTLPAGGCLEIPIRTAVGQALTAKLLQLVDPSKSSSSSSSSSMNPYSPAAADVVADVSANHLSVVSSAGNAADVSKSDTESLGSAGVATLRVQGLAVGLYRLVVPALLLQPPQGGHVGRGWEGNMLQNSSISIRVLPSTAAAAAAAAATGSSAAAAPDTEAAAAAVVEPPEWLWASGMGYFQVPGVLQPSPSKQLHFTSVSCSAAEGLSVRLAGTAEQLSSVQLVAVFSRFLPDSTVPASQLLQNTLSWGQGSSSYEVEGFGFNQGLRDQAQGFGIGSGNEWGLGFGATPQMCGDFGRCSYSSAAKLDSAVAYVLQRRQWEASAAAGGLQRPGSLLQRPSLLVMPRSVRSAASGTSVLRGGDGGRVRERATDAPKRGYKKSLMSGVAFSSGGPMPPTPPPAFYGAPCAAAACGAAMPCVAFKQHSYLTDQELQLLPQGGYDIHVLSAEAPVLGFLKHPAVVLAGLEPSQDGVIELPAEQLQQLLADSATAAAAEDSISPADGSSRDNSYNMLFGPGGFAVVHVAAYDVQQPGQFSSCIAAVKGAAAPEAAAEPDGRREFGLTADVDDAAICALACDVISLAPGATLTLPNADACQAAVYSSSQQLYALLSGFLELAETGGAAAFGAAGWSGPAAAAVGLGGLQRLLPRPVVPPKAGGSSCCSLLRQWEPLLLHWHNLSAAARQELLDKLGSAEMAFYLACRDRAAYEQLVLPLLRAKLPSELCCLEQLLLLQANHNQPPIANATSSTPPSTGVDADTINIAAAETDAYAAAKAELLQHWYAPHRYQRLTVLEQLLLAALDGRPALLRFAADMRQSLETPEQKRGVKQTWMTVDRRALFDFALLVHRQLEQQEQQRQRQQCSAGADPTDDEDDADTEGFAGYDAQDDFVHVGHADAALDDGVQLHSWSAADERPRAVPMPPGAVMPQAAMAPMPKAARMARSAADAADMAARQQLAAAAAGAAHLAPKETQEWAEAGWWKCQGQMAPAGLIPPALFWADFATHLATNPQQPFIPTDPTGVAASTAAITAALAVVGLPCEGSVAAAAAGGGGSFGCSRSYAGSTLTLTATSACLLWVKQVKAVANISAAADISAAGSAGTSSSSSSASTVMVAERLFDPRFAATTDAETGEQLLLSLQPSEQQPLLAGQAYCHSVVITSTGPSEQQLDVLLQLPQGALPLAGSPATTSISITLAPYATKQLTSTFYFHEAGVFKRAPVSVTKRGRPAWLPASPSAPLHVTLQPPQNPTAQPQGSTPNPDFNWSRFLATSNPSQILQYLNSGDPSRARLSDLSPYCRDKAFFEAAVAALSNRHVFDHAVWKWAVAHMHEDALRQLLPMTGLGRRAASFGVVLRGVKLLPLSAADVGLRQLEYWPWVNPYCRPIPRGDGGDANLPSVLQDNPNIAAQWRSFLMAALFDPFDSTSSSSSSSSSGGLGLARAAAAACYLLLQDRVDDAEELLSGVDFQAAAAGLAEHDPLRMQVDYLGAWMALVRPVPTAGAAAAAEGPQQQQEQVQAALAVAKAVVQRYADVGVQPWRKRFAQLTSMAAEVVQQLTSTGQSSGAATPADAAASGAPDPGAAAGPMLSTVSLEGSKLKLTYSGLSEITVSAYHVDTELLFTTQPFSNLSAAAAAAAASSIVVNSSGLADNSSDNTSAGFAGDSGLGKVAFVQPSARIVLQLPLQPGTPGAVAAGAVARGAVADAAGASSSTTAEVMRPACSAAVGCCELDVDVLMPQLVAQSVLLEVAGGGLTRTVPRFAAQLSVRVFESQGVLQACNSTAGGGQAPAAAVYVKVFARDSSGDTWFYKDGYTDLRGKFDYVTLTSTADMSRVARYSLLAASPSLGSVMVQAAPPPK